MNNLDTIYQKTGLNAVAFSQEYAKYLVTLLQKLDHERIAQCLEHMETARQNGNTIFIIGNGGSASTASHIATDFGSAVLKKSTNADDKPYKALALTDNVSVISATANDSAYNNIFLDQLRVHYRPGDKLIAISASGNSPNVVIAAEWFKQQGGTVISWVGFDGGKLKSISDISVLIETPGGEYAPVEDMHLVINHIMVTWMHYHIINGNEKA
jgi:D-sedoheptulose 7-phosphate isomerase